MNINRLIFAVDDFFHTLSRHFVTADFMDYCYLDTVIGPDKADRERRPWLKAPYIATTHRGEYLSVMEVLGSQRETDENPANVREGALESLITHLSDSLNTTYRKKGHKMAFIFERAPTRGQNEINYMLAPQYLSLTHTDVQLQDVLGEKVTTLSPELVRERCWLALWSSPELVSQGDRRSHEELVRNLDARGPACPAPVAVGHVSP